MAEKKSIQRSSQCGCTEVNEKKNMSREMNIDLVKFERPKKLEMKVMASRYYILYLLLHPVTVYHRCLVQSGRIDCIVLYV